MNPNQTNDPIGERPDTLTSETKLTPDELAQTFLTELSKAGYSLTEKVGISRQVRKLLRTETEDAQKLLEGLLDSL